MYAFCYILMLCGLNIFGLFELKERERVLHANNFKMVIKYNHVDLNINNSFHRNNFFCYPLK